ncbi:MAG: aminotransferase class I/II-fold pyridoxal phosphate-dependent enzyme [Candidatus Margulisbacteria bacterium]|nr:aminotransferase class I/II-fold pyridoxal phosphate-dependent enzyme [Candidatus Margulisiibacteriota bacterium]
MKELSARLKQVKPSGIRKFFDLVLNSKDVISLGVGEPDFPTPWHITEQGIYHLEKGHTSYTSNMGLLELRKEISNDLQTRFSAEYDPKDEIMITVGVSAGLDLTFRTLLDPGDEIIIPVPSYVCYEPLAYLAGGVPVIVDTRSTDLILTKEAIEKHITPKTKAVLISYPSNPTGKMINKEQLMSIIETCKKHDLWLISDEVYGDLVYEMEPLSASTYIKDRLILLNGFSKGYAMTGWRIGYVACPREVLNEMVKIQQYNVLCAPIMSQYAAIEALRNGRAELKRMKNSYELRRNYFYESLVEIGFDVQKPEGAFYMFPNVKKFGLSAEDFSMKLLQEGRVAVVPGNAFGTMIDDHVRCCYACSLDELKEAIVRINKFISTL